MHSRSKSYTNVQVLNSSSDPLVDSSESSAMSGQSTVLDLGGLTSSWPSSGSSPLTYRMGNSKISFQKPFVLGVLFLSAIFVLFYFTYSGYSLRSSSKDTSQFYASLHQNNFDRFKQKEQKPFSPVYNATYPLTQPVKTAKGLMYKIAAIADPDTDSKVPEKSNVWRSFVLHGSLIWDASTSTVELKWDKEPVELKSTLSQGGRGMELSELVTFNGALYTVDDRTGVVYKLDGNKVVPWVILSDGPGNESHGFKCEWATVKNEHLYVGGLGKEWTTPDGNVINFNPMFVKKISSSGQIEHIDWHDHYVHLRSSAGIEFPGYMIHEAVVWSDIHKKWFFLPRKASKSKYNDVDDERHGTNMLLVADEDITPSNIKVSHIGELGEPASHGFSSFKFIPGTKDHVILALKSEELEGKIATYVMVFDLDGKILYPETKLGDLKYEGVEFV